MSLMPIDGVATIKNDNNGEFDEIHCKIIALSVSKGRAQYVFDFPAAPCLESELRDGLRITHVTVL